MSNERQGALKPYDFLSLELQGPSPITEEADNHPTYLKSSHLRQCSKASDVTLATVKATLLYNLLACLTSPHLTICVSLGQVEYGWLAVKPRIEKYSF